MSSRSALGRLALVALIATLAAVTVACSKDSPSDGTATLEAAIKAHQAGRLDEAVDLYKQVIDEDPESKLAWYNLGLIHQTRGVANLAETEYRRALVIDPNFVPALFNLAIVRTGRGDLAEAIGLYRHVTELQPDYAAAHLNLGFALVQAGDEKEGQAELDEAVQLDPTLASRLPDGSAASPEPPSGQGDGSTGPS
jgi:tetratricopeptide (TPR) repeat protein